MTMDDDNAIRVDDEERERAVVALREHTARGRLDPDELDERVSAAYRARTRGELADLVRDLPAEQDAAPPARPRRPGTVAFQRHLAVFVVVGVFFVAIWAASGGGSFWPIWALLGWGLGLGIHATKLIGSGSQREAVEPPPEDDDDQRQLPEGR
jgi:hypothetical protein